MMKILSVGQIFDFERNVMAHQFMVRMDDGRQVVISTTEATVKQLVDAGRGQLRTVQPQPAPAPQPSSAPESTPEPERLPGEVSEFGGVQTHDELVDAPEPEPPPPSLGDGRRKRPVRPVDKDGFMVKAPVRTIPMDEMGNPIVAGGPQEPDDEDEEVRSQI